MWQTAEPVVCFNDLELVLASESISALSFDSLYLPLWLSKQTLLVHTTRHTCAVLFVC